MNLDGQRAVSCLTRWWVRPEPRTPVVLCPFGCGSLSLVASSLRGSLSSSFGLLPLLREWESD